MNGASKVRYSLNRLAALSKTCALLMGLCALFATAVFAQEQKSFATPQAAERALYAATKANDTAALLEIFGPDGKELISSGDDVADANGRSRFVSSYQAAHSLVASGAGEYTLSVGADAWKLPIPLVKQASGWVFDTAAGKQEILFRRVGRNELDAIRVCQAIVAAERAYALSGHDGNPSGLYTSHILSEPGKQNGLYWETPEGEAPSPAGELLAEASAEGYTPEKGKHSPFHGYFFRILSAQGSHAPGGAKDYSADGKMTGGFAVLAYPAEYRSSGVMSFLVSRRGTVYQKDLGADTATAARGLTSFDPDSSWKPVK